MQRVRERKKQKSENFPCTHILCSKTSKRDYHLCSFMCKLFFNDLKSKNIIKKIHKIMI